MLYGALSINLFRYNTNIKSPLLVMASVAMNAKKPFSATSDAKLCFVETDVLLNIFNVFFNL